MGVGLQLSNGAIYISHNRKGSVPNDKAPIWERKSSIGLRIMCLHGVALAI